jgi:hypothetical protein
MIHIISINFNSNAMDAISKLLTALDYSFCSFCFLLLLMSIIRVICMIKRSLGEIEPFIPKVLNLSNHYIFQDDHPGSSLLEKSKSNMQSSEFSKWLTA